jgi:amino acid adenylation domain-containing protein
MSKFVTAPLSYHQQRLWFIDQFETGHVYESNPTYHNVPLILHLRGSLDCTRLEQVLNRLLDRHTALRTNIIVENEEPVQVVCADATVTLQTANIADGDSWMEWAVAEAGRPFRLDRDLLLRAALLHVADREAVLVLTLHHLVVDKMSLRLISSELAEIYSALEAGRTSELPKLALEYSDYAEWQRSLTDDVLEPLLFYWRWQLRQPLPALELPASRSRPEVHTYTAAIHSFSIDEDLASEGQTAVSIMFAGFVALLHRYSGQDDITIGTFALCRSQPETENVVGPLANLLPIRIRLAKSATFRTLLAQVNKSYNGALDNQELPFDKLTKDLNLKKDMSRTALFDVLFQFEDEETATFRMGAASAQVVDTNLGYGKYDLNLALRKSGAGFSGTLVYNADIYDGFGMEQMMRHYVAILRAMSAAPEQRIDDPALLSKEEEHQQLVEWNSSQASYPAEKTIHQLFEEQVFRTPNHVAVVSGDLQLTYADLNVNANRLAHRLIKAGASPNSLVGVCLNRSAETIVTLLAVLKAGAAYLPLDPSYPEERLRFMVEDAHISCIITTSALHASTPLDVPSLILLDEDSEDIAACPVTAPDNVNSPEDLAYCIYTSGSTGQPKGALLEHRNVVRLLVNDRLQFAFSDTDVWTMFHSYAFDFSVWEMYGALLYGGRLIIVPKAATRDPLLFLELLVQEKVTILNQTPSSFLNLANTMLQRPQADLALRYVIFGGEALHPLQLRDWHRSYPAVKLVNLYGITETTVHVTFKEIAKAEIEGNLSNVGVPIPTTTVYVLDANLRLLPVGVPGEICVGGLGVGRGYLDRAELTSQKFIENPYRPGETLYRSGDLGKFLPNGELIHLGRIDDQVQIRGFRVELGEIQTRLIKHPAVAQAEIVARQTNSNVPEIVAYVVSSGELNISAVRTYLARTLPEYMLPSALVILKALPLTPNGKVDRRALPEPKRVRPETDTSYAAPRTPTEDLLTGLWARTLGRELVGIHDNFFELGGHSLLATQLFSRIRDAFSVELELRLLFESPTIAGLSQHVETACRDRSLPAAPPINRASRTGPLPLSFAQQRLWFLNQLEPDNTAYNVPAMFRIHGPLDVAALEQSLAEIVSRHEVLRTGFRVEHGAPVQGITAHAPVQILVTDLRGTPPEQQTAIVDSLAYEVATHVFDLGQSPLLRITLLHLADEEYVLLTVMHHIISDAWSTGVLVRETIALYKSIREGESCSLPELPIQYADFAVWQREWLKGDVLESQIGYWRRQLAGAPVSVSLVADRPQVNTRTSPGRTHFFRIDAGLTSALRTLSRESGATLFMTLLTGFATLLHRYSGREDLVIGTPIANRNRSETEALIGFFVNTLVLRADVSGQPTFQELLQRIRQVSVDAYAHQDLPFEQLVEVLRPERTLSNASLFQVMFSLQNAQAENLQLPGLTLTPIRPETGTSKFDLTLMMEETGPDMIGAVEYNTDLFGRDTITRMVEHFQTVLRAAVANPGERISTLPLLSAAERRQTLESWIGGETVFPRETCIHGLFETQTLRTPETTAVEFGDEQLTYRELNSRANQVAHYLRRKSARPVGPENRVGLLVERSVRMIVGMLGILKTGAAYVPLDPITPSERLESILNDAGVSTLLTQESLSSRLHSSASSSSFLIRLDTDWELICQMGEENPISGAISENLAYVIYTSGSTGTPKGVAVTHRSVARLVCDTDYVQLNSADKIAQVSNASFDAATFEVWGALLHGGRLVGIDRQTTLSPPQFAEQLVRLDVSVLFLTTALFNEIARQVPNAFKSLRCLLFGGESVTPKWVQRVLENGPPRQLLHVYGPTENTTFSSWHQVEQVPEDTATIPIGRAISNTQIYLLSPDLEPVPIGVAGELYLAGDGLARGYLGRPDLTAEAFIPHPWSSRPGALLYKTGDIARYRANGEVEFLGRRDHQVKVRGFRIELGEVEAALKNHPSVQETVVLSTEHEGLNSLVAYVVPHSSEAGNRHASLAGELRQFLSARLPAYMVPSCFTMLDVLPLNANGKVDRALLPAPTRNVLENYVPPRNATEEILCGIWSDVLDLPKVGTADNFFELGGHSLLATQLVSRLRDTFRVELPLAKLFDSPTPSGLAMHIEAVRVEPTNEYPPPFRISRETQVPLSFAQERLWFLNQLEPGNPFYNVALAVRLKGPLSLPALGRSLDEVVRRHEALRTTFATIDGRAAQQIGPEFAVPVEMVDLTSPASNRQDDEVHRYAADEARCPFNLVEGPLVRARLLRLQAEGHVLLLTMHHIVSDGWSMGVLLRELSVCYSDFTAGRPVSLPTLPIQYADFACWQREWLDGEVLANQLRYWKRQLTGAPQVLNLPTDRPRPRVQSFQGSSEYLEVSAHIAEKLRALSHRSGATLFMTLFSAFATLLQRYSDQDDFVIGTPIANRTRAEIEPLIGFFVNTLALRFDGSGDPTFIELLGRVRQLALDAYAHQDLPFERLVDELGVERDLTRNPLFQVMFALQNAPVRMPELPGLELESVETKRVAAQFDLVLDVWETPTGLKAVWEYNTDLFDAATVRRMASHFHGLLEAIGNDPAQRLSELPILSWAERQQLLQQGRGVDREYPYHRTLQEFFEQHATAGPDRIAAVNGDAQISYGSLNRQANQIAHWLRRRGVQKNDFVAILEERGTEFLAAMLGVLKAGAAFLPIDPHYPADRIRYMLDDSQVRTLITRRARLHLITEGNWLRSVLSFDDGVDRDGIRFFDLLDLQTEAQTNPIPVNTSADLAYMLYTSGSTGLPKGAMIRHNGAVNHIFAQFEELAFHSETAFLQSAPSSSDISVWQFLAPLLIGGRTVIADFETVCDAAKLFNTIRSNKITLIELVPVVLQSLLSYASTLGPAERALPDLEWAMVTGESVQPALVNQWLQTYPKIRIVNAYGPTEAADDICQGVISFPLAAEEWNVPIGRPLANLSLYVLDRHLNLAVAGAQGEICVSGVGVGAGYWRRDEQTRSSFVPNPYSTSELDAVLYRTGDLGRWRPDDMLEVTGRIDDQVKLHGFRIELGEIESLLGAHPEIQQSAVVVREDETGEKRLVAHVVPRRREIAFSKADAQRQDEQISLWESLHDNDYSQPPECPDPTFNTIGWDNTYTGLPLSQHEMQEYVNCTVERILSLRPRRALELGCGTGLLAFRLLRHCDEYWGTDLSAVAIRRLQGLQGLVEGSEKLKLFHRKADDFEGLGTECFDTVVINSVIQYFPNVDYLVRVLHQAVRAVRSGGAIFIGDVRNLRLFAAYHTSVQLFKAAPSTARNQLDRRIRRQMAQEQELLIDPAFFLAFQRHCPRISHVRIEPKRGRYQNEFTRFRCDVTLHVERESSLQPEIQWLEWQDARASIPVIRQRLIDEEPEMLAFRSVPNARLCAETKALEMLQTASIDNTGQLKQKLSQLAPEGVDPEDLWNMGLDLPYMVDICVADSDPSAYHVVFRRCSGTAPLLPLSSSLPQEFTSWGHFGNNPLQEKFNRDLASELQGYLKSKLPKHMVPSHFVVSEALPVTPAGKIDRLALPAPDFSTGYLRTADSIARTPVEQCLSAIWSAVLGLGTVGILDNFFDLGGHSLKATQVVSRIHRELGVEIALREIFNHPTIAELAMEIEKHAPALFKGIEKTPDAEHHPLSHAQRRLWVLSQIEAASRAYNMSVALSLEGKIDQSAFERALGELVHRHESLRTTFLLVEGEPRQRIRRTIDCPMDFVDLSAEPFPGDRARELAREDAATLFDLEQGPLLRARLLKLNDDSYVILFNMHHIASDGRSMSVLINDFVRMYQSIREARPDAAAELRIQYRDYSAWQKQLLETEAAAADRDYWHRKLSGELPVLNLPLDLRRPAEKTYNGNTLYFNLGSAVTAAMDSFCRHQGVTVFMTLVAAVKALLFRYTGQGDILIGTPVEGRTHPDLEQQIGFYVNMLALRNSVRADDSFGQLLQQVKATVTEALEHQMYPFDRLVNELNLDRDVSRSPLFDVVVVLQDPDASEFTLPDVRIRPFLEESPVSKFDLAFNFEPRPEGLGVVLVYNTDLFLPDRIERLRDHFEQLLTGILADASRPLRQQNILPPSEREKILRYSNSAARECETRSTIVGLFEAQVNKTPDRIALSHEDTTLTYRELNARANRLAHYLRVQGVEANTLVGICVDRSVEMVIALIGILKAGGAYLPFDLRYPKERLAFISEDARTAVILTEESLSANFSEQGARVVCLDSDRDSIARHSSENPGMGVSPTDLAYVIYTSGSTGRPKGVLITHHNVTRLFSATEAWFHFDEKDVWTFFHSYAFDFSVWEIWGALLHGGRLVVVPYLTSRSPEAFYELLQREQVTVLNQTPVAFRQLIQTGAFSDSEAELKLRLVIFGGEALDVQSLHPWFERHNERTAQLVNMYGITETTVHVTYRPINAADLQRPASMIGCPIPDLQVYILDDDLNPAPIGVTGQMYIGGAGVAAGYLNRPELTAERFVANPFSRKSGERLYKSGDLACFHPNGDIQYLGRADDQVKIRGFRIELGEIGSVLAQHRGVRECVVITDADNRLVAYITPQQNQSLSTNELRLFLNETLPDYMVPQIFVILDGSKSLPLTPNGKLDRRAVSAADVSAAPQEFTPALPLNEMERTIADVWREVLRLDKVATSDNFFDVGGDSVAIIQVHNKLREVLSCDLSVTALFKYSTIGALAEHLSQTQQDPSETIPQIQGRARQQIEARQMRRRRGTV